MPLCTPLVSALCHPFPFRCVCPSPESTINFHLCSHVSSAKLLSFLKKDNIVATSKNRHNSDSRLSLNLFWCVSFPRNKKSFREEKTPKRKTTNTEKKRGNRHQCSRIDREPLSRAHRWPAIASAFIKKEGRFFRRFLFFLFFFIRLELDSGRVVGRVGGSAQWGAVGAVSGRIPPYPCVTHSLGVS